MSAKKIIPLKKRYNKDGSISLYARGRVVFNAKRDPHHTVEVFARGWFDGQKPRFLRPVFATNQ